MVHLSKTYYLQLLVIQIVVVLLESSFTSAKLSDDKIKSFINVDAKDVMKKGKGKEEVHIKTTRDRSSPVSKTTNFSGVDSHPHPFHKPNIVNDIKYSYRKYREMILVRAGKFWKGTNDPKSETGEYPIREVKVKSFYLDAFPVINADYWAFRAKKKFVRSDAEKKGWSWVVDIFLSDETREHYSYPGSKGWAAVKKAKWDMPEGPDSTLEDRWIHPIVHVSWYDAKQFCEFHGKRLPTEPEWEFASRAGALNYAYPWADNWERKRANVWQGKWPHENRRADGYSMTSPVDAYKPQTLTGFYDMIGNVWEWTATAYRERMVEAHLLSKMAVLKGGSYVDSVNGKVNYPVRVGQRMGQKQDYTAANVGFRCARAAPDMDRKIEEEKIAREKAKEPKVREPRIIRKKRRDEL